MKSSLETKSATEEMAEVPEEELAKMVAMLSKLNRHQGMKIPGVGSFSRDELVKKMIARDPAVFSLIAIYRVKRLEVVKNVKRDLLAVLKNAPMQDAPVKENMFIISNPKGYNAREIARHIEEDTPDGIVFVQQFYEETRGGKVRAAKKYLDAQPSAVKAAIAIRSLVQWGRTMIEGVLKLGKSEQKKLE